MFCSDYGQVILTDILRSCHHSSETYKIRFFPIISQKGEPYSRGVRDLKKMKLAF